MAGFVCFTVKEVIPPTLVHMRFICIIESWLLPLGLTLILATVTVKTWRLYRIFVHRKPGRLLEDWALVLVVLMLAFIDIIICSVWTAVFPVTLSSQETVTDNNMIEVKVNCSAESNYVFLGIISLYQGILMISAVVLAFLTKNIHHESFKTKSVVFLVYFLAITLFLGFPLYFILNTTRASGVNAEYTVLSLTYLCIVYECFVFLFFPPVLILFKEKLFHQIPGLRKFSTTVKSKTKDSSSQFMTNKKQ